MPDTYESLLVRYRGYVAHLHRALLALLADQGMAEDDAVSTMDRLYEQAVGRSATLLCLLRDVPEVAGALTLTQCLCVFVAMKGVDAALRGAWVHSEHPALPSEADLARLLELAWRGEQAKA
jgi:hypothetical protein